jgi:LPXTG-site transpeptidase (sortase) family protein
VLFRSALGYALFCLGGGTLAFASGRYAVGALRQQEARQSWDEAESRAVVALARRTTSVQGYPARSIVPGAPVAHLAIRRLGIDEIVLEGVDDDMLNAGPGHMPGSAFPGEHGNAVISGHRDRHFARLALIRVGDTVMTESGAHRDTWVVISTRVVDADEPALFRTRDATLTLTTCWPIRYVGSAPERLLITATSVGAPPPSFAAALAN